MTVGDFSEQANWYGQARPTYPPALIDLLAADAGVKAGDPVVDFGAGTGILTRMLVDRQFDVTAIEPNAPMRSQNDVGESRWIDGTFEQSHLDDASQRWAVAAQAFHWADPPRALPEIRRILQPGCQFTILWNNRSNKESEILQWTEAAIRRAVPEFDEAYRNQPWSEILESTGDFVFLSTRVYAHVIVMSKPRYLNLWKSHNRLNNLAGPERFAKFVSEVEEYLEQQGIEQIDVPYNCQSWSARRVP